MAEAFTPSVWLFACGMAGFGLGFGSINAAINVHAAHHFSARQINWTHASYGAGATLGPLLATLLLDGGLSWHWVYGLFGGVQAVLALVFALTGRAWVAPPRAVVAPAPRPAERSAQPRKRRLPTAAVVGSLTFIAVETGIETGAGIWGYVFLIQGRGLTHAAAGVALSAYWAMMFLGRVVLGAVAGRVGPSRVLAAAVAGVSLGCALMTAPGPGLLAVAGLMVVGLAAATRSSRCSRPDHGAASSAAGGAAVTVSLQVGASAVGSAALPACFGLSIGAFTATALGPWLLVLSLTMYVLFHLLSRARPELGLYGKWGERAGTRLCHGLSLPRVRSRWPGTRAGMRASRPSGVRERRLRVTAASGRRPVALTNMWRMDVRTLSTAERALWDAFPRGESVDLAGRQRVGARTIRAEVIAALLLGARRANPGRIAAVRLNGTRITGTLDLGHGLVTVPVRLRRCEVTDVDRPDGSEDAAYRPVGLETVRPHRTARAPSTAISTSADASAPGAVVLSGAHVTGSLDVAGRKPDAPGLGRVPREPPHDRR